jgi:hypothetical protein
MTTLAKGDGMPDQDLTTLPPVRLPTVLTIRQSGSVCERLRAAFETAGDIVIDIPDDAEADLSFIQLIEASRRYAEILGRGFSLCRPARGSVHATLVRGGFLTDMMPRDSQFWLHRKEQMQ